MRATIALAVAFVLAPRWLVAAPQDPVQSGTPAEDVPPAGDVERSSSGSPPGPATRRRNGSLPDRPFAGPAESPDAGNPGAPEGDASDVDDTGADEDDAGGGSLRALSCLEGEGGNDRDGARRGVQKRDFLKKRRAEIAILGGYHASDALSSTYVYGGAVSFFPSEDFGAELMVTRNPVAFRLEEPFNSFQGERHFQPGVAWNVLGAMLWSPIHAKLRWSERHITHLDMLVIAGGGQTTHESVQGITFQAGVGLKLYLARFVSLRFDVRDLMIPQEVLGRGRTTHNLVTMIGFCAWVPG
ncbi:MAG: outer membrane beta-barrel domain-containing protein [Pseudomonadota bacterium]